MKIAYVSTDSGVPAFGSKGASVHVQELLRAYRRLGHEVVLVAAYLDGSPPPDLQDIEVVELGRARDPDAGRREYLAMEVDTRAYAWLQGRDDLDLVHERYSLWGGAGVAFARQRAIPSVLEVNAPLIDEHQRHRELVHVDQAHSRLRRTAHDATSVIAVSELVAGWLRRRTGRLDGVEVIPNGVDTDRFVPAETDPDGPFTVGFVGSLKPWHGVETLVESMALVREKLPQVQLRLVGDGPRRETVLNAARDAGISTTCTGAVTPADVPGELHRMHVACAPYPPGSNSDYFSPLKVVEYLAAGVPVVASDTGQLPELLEYGHCGVLVPPGDAGALGTALLALARDPARRRQLSEAGRAAAQTQHQWEHVAERTLAAAMMAHKREVPA